MEALTSFDILLLELGLFGFIVSLARSYLKRLHVRKTKAPEFPLLQSTKHSTATVLPPTRSIKKQLEQTGKDVVIFYGSQTGTAERLASRLAKQAKLDYNLNCLVADLEDYDHHDLQSLGDKQLAIFVLATYGDGEPTDNAVPFNLFLRDTERKGTDVLSSLGYAAFGLGSTSYQFYNAMIRHLDEVLSASGASRLGPLGLGDDGKGTLEDDFTQWAAAALAQIAGALNMPQVERQYTPSYNITETAMTSLDGVFLGEPNKSQVYQAVSGPFTADNPYPATIAETRELFSTVGRNCIHVDFDTSGTTVGYDTGDHLAVWPTNSDLEVARFLQVFGLKGDAVINITSKDASEKVPVPSPTTYASIARHYLDICAPITRSILAEMTALLPSGPLSDRLGRLTGDVSAFHSEVTLRRLNLAQLMSITADEKAVTQILDIPFSFLLEILPKLKPRRYSISSSALASRNSISITAVVDADLREQSLTNPYRFQGVSTSYLLALHSQAVKKTVTPTHQLHLPRFTAPSTGIRPLIVPIHVSRSKFRMPRHHTTPMIMIGPGTGVAPFRAFVQERAYVSKLGREVGEMHLLYGCRDEGEVLYKEEWDMHRNSLPEGTFEMYTAFSRKEGTPKAYVQDLLVEQAQRLQRLVGKGAHVYVCGDAKRMAKDVSRAFSQILGEDKVAALRKDGRWSEDVW